MLLRRVKLLCCMLGISPLRPAVAALNWTSSGGLGAADALRSYAAAGGMGSCSQDRCTVASLTMNCCLCVSNCLCAELLQQI